MLYLFLKAVIPLLKILSLIELFYLIVKYIMKKHVDK